MEQEVVGTIDQWMGPLNDVETKYAPSRVYVAGRVELLRHFPRVAIVGSREASPSGLERAERIARRLVSVNAIIISGLARGVDTVAHRAAIDGGGSTIAVLGTPLDVVTPRANKGLQDLIKQEHLAISQFASGTPVRPHQFPVRNRLMALVCHASVIIEAGNGSGTLSQGWEALRLGRPLFIMQEVFADSSLTWPLEMLKYGAQMLSDGAEELLDFLPGSEQTASPLQHAF